MWNLISVWEDLRSFFWRTLVNNILKILIIWQKVESYTLNIKVYSPVKWSGWSVRVHPFEILWKDLNIDFRRHSHFNLNLRCFTEKNWYKSESLVYQPGGETPQKNCSCNSSISRFCKFCTVFFACFHFKLCYYIILLCCSLCWSITENPTKNMSFDCMFITQ